MQASTPRERPDVRSLRRGSIRPRPSQSGSLACLIQRHAPNLVIRLPGRGAYLVVLPAPGPRITGLGAIRPKPTRPFQLTRTCRRPWKPTTAADCTTTTSAAKSSLRAETAGSIIQSGNLPFCRQPSVSKILASDPFTSNHQRPKVVLHRWRDITQRDCQGFVGRSKPAFQDAM